MTIIVIAGVGCASTAPDINTLEAEGYEVRIYEVFGMDCPGCHGGLENLVNKVSGVKTSKANWEKKQITVVLIQGAQVDDSTIHSAINEANFTPGKRIK